MAISTMKSDRQGQIATWLILSLASAMSLAGVGFWQIAPCEFNGRTSAEFSGEIAVPYNEFRTMMVRNNANQSIVEQGGMKLIDEEVLNMDIDLSRDNRPLLNAILRRSQSCVTASKRLTVAVDNTDICVDKLQLHQDARITPECLDVNTASEVAVGDLKHYRTTLHAEPKGESTAVTISVELSLCKELGKLFHTEAQQRLDTAAQQTALQQFEALVQFADENAKRSL